MVARNGCPHRRTHAATMSTRKDLWGFYATGGFLRRNVAFALELAVLANETGSMRRVFEFASDGSFMTIHALARPGLRSTLEHWVTSDVSPNALRHSTWLFNCGALCVARPRRPLVVPPYWDVTNGTYFVNQTRVDVRSVDVNQLDRVVEVNDFDTFVTISFEHIFEDFRFLAMLPCNAWFVFSVPNFGLPKDAETLAASCRDKRYTQACDKHWHVFRDEGEIRARYGRMLRIRRIHRVKHIGSWVKFVVSGQRTCVKRRDET